MVQIGGQERATPDLASRFRNLSSSGMETTHVPDETL